MFAGQSWALFKKCVSAGERARVLSCVVWRECMEAGFQWLYTFSHSSLLFCFTGNIPWQGNHRLRIHTSQARIHARTHTHARMHVYTRTETCPKQEHTPFYFVALVWCYFVAHQGPFLRTFNGFIFENRVVLSNTWDRCNINSPCHIWHRHATSH